MEGLNDFILKKRVDYLEKLKGAIKNLTPENPRKAFAEYMLCENEYSFKGFLKGFKKTDFYKTLIEELGTFSNDKLMKTKLFKEDMIYNDRVITLFDRVTSSIDAYYAPFLEPLTSLPLYFTGSINKKLEESERIKADINCVGKALTVIALYSEGNDINDLEIHRVYSTNRIHKIIDALRKLEEGNHIIIDENSPYLMEESKDFISSKEARELFIKLRKNSSYDFVYIDVDIFHGEYSREHLREMLLEHALSLDYFTHVHIHNKRIGETYDYKLEIYGKENYYVDEPITGTLKTSLHNFATFFSGIHPHKASELYSFFREYYEDKEDLFYLSTISRIIMNMNHIELILGNKIHELKSNVEKILEIFGKEKTPINWLLVASGLGIIEEEEMKAIITRRFNSSKAYEKAKKRFGF